MYNPPAFREDRPEALRALIEAARLVLLVSNGPAGVPEASHLPMVFEPGEGPLGTLYGHLARANPHCGALAAGRALAVLLGPEAYVSPGLYPSKARNPRLVPTWNYVAVHAYGPVEFFQEPERLLDAVTRLTNRHEGSRAKPWAVTDAPEDFIATQLRGIVGVRIPVVRFEGKRKMSQNRPEADRVGVAQGLAASENAGDREVAPLIPVPV
jgi:transcriptional regulator